MRGASDLLRRIGIFAITLMVVSSMVAPSAMAATTTTTTAAAPDGDPCDPNYGRGLLEIVLDPANVADYSDESACQAQQMVQNATWADLYASGLAQADLGKAGVTSISNHVEDSKTYARTIAKTEAVKLFNNQSNGLTKAEIKAQVNDSIESYYATMQSNLLTTHNANVNQAWYAFKSRENTGVNTTALGQAYRWYDEDQEQPFLNFSDFGEAWENDSSDTYTQHNITVSLVDDSNMTISAIKWVTNSGSDTLWVDPTNQTTESFSDNTVIGFAYADPDASHPANQPWDQFNSGNAVIGYNEHPYAHAYYRINQTTADMKVQGAAYVDLLFTNYNRSQGEDVDISEVLNPNDLASQWNTNYNTTGYYGWISATLGLTGLEGNVNSSFAINYTPAVNHTDNGNYSLNGSGESDYVYVAGESYNISGTLMTDWDPNPTQTYAFKRGATYDTSNANAPVLFIEQVNSTESRVVRLNGTFTIDALTNVQTGETINSTSLEEQNQQTWNESSSIEEIQQLVEYRNKSVTINEAGGGGTGGGGLFDGFNFGSAGLGFIVIAGGGALLLLNRS